MGLKINKSSKFKKGSFFTEEQEIWIYDWLFQNLEIESFSSFWEYKRSLLYISEGNESEYLNVCINFFEEAFETEITVNQYNELNQIIINYAKNSLQK